jgi:PRTRC genetic system protein E
MQTNFFSLVTQLAPNLDWNIRITKVDNDQYIVFVHPFNDTVTDSAKHAIKPLVLNPATADVLDSEFFQSIQQPVQKVSTLLADMEGHQKSVEEARQKSQLEKAARDQAEKEKKEKQGKYDTMMKKVEELEKAQKWGEATGAMPNPKDFPQWETEINKKLAELRSKNPNLSLFNA